MTPRFVTVAAVCSGTLSVLALIYRWLARRRASTDVGPVSSEWLAHRRGVLGDEP